MNRRMICRVLGLILECLAGLLILPTVAGLCYGEGVTHFLITMALSGVLGFLLARVKPYSDVIYAKDGFVVVSLGWVLMSLIGALPFVLSGDIPNYIDALFETVSGFTTTGASILEDVEGLSRGCMFWRSFTHWIGGMGVLVFIMAVLPMSGEHSMHIMRAEVPGPTVGKLVPRLRQTAKILYLIYIAMTLLEMLLLLLGGMSFYDALLHAFATAGTGGFSTKSASIAAFDSLYLEMVIAVFMVLFGVNFNLYFLLLIGRWKDALKSEELHWYLGIIAASVMAITLGISKMYGGIAAGLRHAFFYVASITSSTGFGTVDFVTWPEYCKWIIVMLMFCGACAGSTGGGIKTSRVIILFRNVACEIRQMIHPRTVTRVQLDGKRVDTDGLKAVSTFFTSFMLLLITGSFLVSLDGYDMATNFSAVLSSLSNIGPGMSLIGPTGNYNIFSYGSKLVLTVMMLIGRLEIFPILILFSPSTWKK
ncbi:MAG: TrkH family potassium uptake protein [Oscillospiraceae bacterium]|nr:TrkH family potassium uptake protein [Oscillospiraceae bacterium]